VYSPQGIYYNIINLRVQYVHTAFLCGPPVVTSLFFMKRWPADLRAHYNTHYIIISLHRPCRHTREKRRAACDDDKNEQNIAPASHYLHNIISASGVVGTYNISFTRTRRTRLLSSRANIRGGVRRDKKNFTTIALLLCNNNSPQ